MQGIGILARNRWAPLLITSLIFGLMHYFNPEVSEYGAAVMLPQYIWFHHPIHKRRPLTMLTASPRFRWKRFFWGGGIWLAMMVVTSVLSVVAGYQDVELHFNPTVVSQSR